MILYDSSIRNQTSGGVTLSPRVQYEDVSLITSCIFECPTHEAPKDIILSVICVNMFSYFLALNARKRYHCYKMTCLFRVFSNGLHKMFPIELTQFVFSDIDLNFKAS